ncbi:MAG TPA: patatin-like phospholipase family protein [Nevskia sp.]|nr:patatin-like phospholipase family protein [Nevskia sp.]
MPHRKASPRSRTRRGRARPAVPKLTAIRRGGGQTAWVFAGGGSLGAVQVGMLKALVRHKLRPDLVVGASVGAINGAYFAGRPGAAGVAALEQIWRGIHQDDVFPVTLRSGVAVLVGHRNYLVDPSSLAELIGKLLPFERIEQARLPCYVVTTDIYNGHEVCFSEGDAKKAVLASASIPGVFPPVQYGDRYLVDGGVANNTPISTAVELGAKRVVVLPTGFSCSISQPPPTLVAMALHALNLMIMKQLVRDIAVLSSRAEIVVVPPLCPVEITPYDFSQTGSLIERAERSTEQWLKQGGLQPGEIPHELLPHNDADDPDVPYVVPRPRRKARARG